MSVYIDPKGHLVADSRDELHEFAQRLGLQRKWFQDKRLWHYDVTSIAKRSHAVLMGALPISERTAVHIIHAADGFVIMDGH